MTNFQSSQLHCGKLFFFCPHFMTSNYDDTCWKLVMALFQPQWSLNELKVKEVTFTEVKEGVEIRTRIQESLLLFWHDCFSFEDDELPQSSYGFLLCVCFFLLLCFQQRRQLVCISLAKLEFAVIFQFVSDTPKAVLPVAGS